MSDVTLENLEQAQADGRISVDDADAMRNFAAFLEAAGPHRTSPEFDRKRFAKAYREHYPEDYAQAVAEHRARQTRQENSDA